MTADKLAAARAMRAGELTLAQIAAQLGVSVSSVSRALAEPVNDADERSAS